MTTDWQASDQPWSEPQDNEAGPLPAKPGGSVIEISRFEDGITIRVPPAGLWRGSRGLFAFSLVWNIGMLVFSVVMLGAFFGAKPDGEWWVLPLVLSIFWAVGIGLLLAGINMGRRQAGLAVAGGTLMAMQTGLFGTKQREWPLAQVATICAGPSGMTVNNVPVLELQIFGQGGDKLGLLAGRSDEELRWLAFELCQAVELHSPGDS